MKLNSALAQRITSSASRDRCTASSAAAAQNSTAKSRSLTASMEFCVSCDFAVGIHEAEQLGDEHAVERQGGAGNRAAAERADVHARVAIPEPLAIAFEHLDVGEQVMREIDGLGALQVRVAGNDDVGVVLAERDERALQAGDFAEQRGDFVAQPEPHVERDLVVARAGGVEFRAGGNASVSSASMFMWTSSSSGLPLEFAGLDFAGDGFQPADDGARLPLR